MRLGLAFIGRVALLLAFDALFVMGDFLEATDQLLPAHASIELIGVILFAAALPLLGRPAVIWGLGALTALGGLVRLADIMTPWYFGRPFNAASDIGFLPLYLDILRGAVSIGLFLAVLAGGALALILLVALGRLAWGALWRIGAERRWGSAVAAGVLILAVWALAPPRYLEEPTRPLFAGEIAAAMARSVGEFADLTGLAGDYRATIDAANAAHPPAGALPGLGRRNVLLIYFESYGAVTFNNPDFRSVIEPARAAFGHAAAAAGYAVVSNFLVAPITGGGSWLAHATLESGVKIQTQPIHDVLRASGAATLGSLFRAAGYRTLAAMPHIAGEWPESRFFGFDTLLARDDFHYVGPLYSWDSIPDQFVLRRVAATAFHGGDKPLFARFVLSSSHTPFDRIPPLLDDRGDPGDGSAYRDSPIDRHPVEGGDIFSNDPGYLAAVVYDFAALSRFVTQEVADDSLVILLGDHQPPLSTARASHDLSIPMHVLCRDPALLAPFRAMGFVDGMTPARAKGDVPTERFLDFFLGAYGAARG